MGPSFIYNLASSDADKSDKIAPITARLAPAECRYRYENRAHKAITLPRSFRGLDDNTGAGLYMSRPCALVVAKWLV